MPRCKNLNKYWVCDFETTTDDDDCRVWAWAACNVKFTWNTKVGTDINSFWDWVEKIYPRQLYFHNLKFDGEFIMYHLFKRGYKYVNSRRKLEPGYFTTLISDRNVFYTIDVCIGRDGENKKQIVSISDSMKLIPRRVEQIPKDFGLEEQKLKIDYSEYRPPDHRLTPTEEQYIRHDVIIVAKALHYFFDNKMWKMTQASNALEDYIQTIGRKNFNRWFPILDCDSDIRQAYKGGWAYCEESIAGKDMGEGLVFDVNSLYPWVLHDCLLPYGTPEFFDDAYKYDKVYPLYIQCFSCSFELRPGFLPMLQLKNNARFTPTQYLKSSNGELVTLYLTSVDLELFMQHYKVTNVTWINGWKFKASNKMFYQYIDKWMEHKIYAEESGNKGLRFISKLMMNALYGKFGLNPKVRSKKVKYDDQTELIRYENDEWEQRDTIYTPVAVFTTAYARRKTITNAQKLRPRFLYADTDSLHIRGTKIPAFLEIHKTRLGAWKLESRFQRARFLRAKCYIEDLHGDLKVTVAGLPDKCHWQVNWDNFHFGMIYSGKLQMKHVKNGIVLHETTYEIKP